MRRIQGSALPCHPLKWADAAYTGQHMISLIPGENWEYRCSDLWTGFAAAGKPRKHPDDLYIPGIGKCIPARSGRAALITAIRALDLRAGAGIGVPLYCCPVVFKAIDAAGCKNVFIDIDPATYCMAASDLSAKSDRIDAVVAVHMFGNMCAMPDLRQAVMEKPIIEDCAQALGSKLNEHAAGTFGDISFFSFRSGKYLSAGEGGALFSNREETLAAVSRIVSALPEPGSGEEFNHVAKTYLRSKLRSKPLYGLVGHRLWAAYNKVVADSDKSPVALTQIFKSDQSIALKRMESLDSMIETQRAIADYYLRNLTLAPEMLCSEKSGEFYNRYLFPIAFPSSRERDFIEAFLMKRSIAAIKPYHDIAEVAAAYYGYRRDCPASEQAAKRLLVIPSYYSLTVREKRHIVEHMNAGWMEIIAND